jgi:hypothetical protein
MRCQRSLTPADHVLNTPRFTDKFGSFPVKRFPTKVSLTCAACGRHAEIKVMLERIGDLRCSGCGARDPIVDGRDMMRQWARRRRNRNSRNRGG